MKGWITDLLCYLPMLFLVICIVDSNPIALYYTVYCMFA
jgi:hypothetical protein